MLDDDMEDNEEEAYEILEDEDELDPAAAEERYERVCETAEQEVLLDTSDEAWREPPPRPAPDEPQLLTWLVPRLHRMRAVANDLDRGALPFVHLSHELRQVNITRARHN